ncbi:MAG TPA: MFS transporter [Terriglobales bacterium]|nr:MFS transporter [Terriglobales bacterium]
MLVASDEKLQETRRKVSWIDLLFGSKARITWTISIGCAIHAFGWFLVSTIMPSVILQLGKPQLLSWGTTAFLALSIPGSASAGYLKNRFGIRPVLMGAALTVIAATSLGLVAPNMTVFLLARAIQGLGDGMVLAFCYIIVSEALEPQEMNPAFGILAVVWAVATLIGPGLGGLLTDWFSWRMAFMPMLVLSVLLLILVASERRIARPAVSDKAGLPLGRLATLALAIGAVSVAGAGETGAFAVVLLAAALALILYCFRLDHRSAQRLFPQHLLSLRRISALGIWILGFMFAADSGPPIYMTYFVQVGHGTSVFFAGQFAAITALAWSVSAIAVSHRGGRFGRAMLLTGPSCLLIGFTALTLWQHLPLPLSGIALMVIGSGFGLSYAFFTEQIIAHAPENERDVTAGAIPTLESICAAFGAATAGLLGNLAGFGGFGASDIPPAVPLTVFGASALGSAFILYCAWRFWRQVRAMPRS